MIIAQMFSDEVKFLGFLKHQPTHPHSRHAGDESEHTQKDRVSGFNDVCARNVELRGANRIANVNVNVKTLSHQITANIFDYG